MIFTQHAFAQQPLNKRDQLKKAAFEAQIASEEKYAQLRELADNAFRNREYARARNLYDEAIQYNKKDEQWLISKVNDLDILMADIIAREVDTISVIKRIELEKLKQEDQRQAQNLEIRKDTTLILVSEPENDSLESINVSDIVEQNRDETTPLLEDAASKPQKVQPLKREAIEENAILTTTPLPVEEKEAEDYSKFPQGRSDEEFVFPDHTVRRIVIRDRRDVIVYKYVTHRWGGKFYFKDGVSIVERIWKQEVADYEQRFPINLAEKTD
jgi:hypothetical protein